MAISPTSSTSAANSVREQQRPTSATSKPKADFSKTLASAGAPAPANPPAAPKQVNTSATSNLQSGDGTKATA